MRGDERGTKTLSTLNGGPLHFFLLCHLIKYFTRASFLSHRLFFLGYFSSNLTIANIQHAKPRVLKK